MKKLILIAFACSFCLSASAIKNDGETKSAKVTVDISDSDIINIESKYTELIIETWNKPQVEIEAVVRYDGKMTDRIQEFLNEFESIVQNNIRSGAGEVSINSELDFPNRGIKKTFFGLVMEINLGDSDDAKLTYRIKAPGNNKYVISNSYEDARLVGSFKDVEFKQYSGELEAESIEVGEFNLKYGSASFQRIGEARMEIYEQEIDAKEIGSLDINAKYSNLELVQLGNVEAISYESDFQIGSIDQLSGNFKYGEIEVTERLGEAKLEFYEMDMEVNKADEVRLTSSKYSKFNIDKAGSVTFDQSYEDETEFGTLASFRSMNSKYGNHVIEVLTSRLLLNAYEDEVEIEELGPKVSEINIDGKYIDTSIGIRNTSFILKSNVKYGNVDYDESAVDVKRYIKDGDQLEVEVHSKNPSGNIIDILVKGYEVDIILAN